MSDLARIVVGPDDAPALVLLHGITSSALSQADAIGHWAARGYRVVAVDARGHGLSPRWTPAELERAGQVLVDDVVAVLEDLDVERRGRAALGLGAPPPPVLIGHSMGAATAMVVGARRPGLVRGLVLIDPARYGARTPAELLAGLAGATEGWRVEAGRERWREVVGPDGEAGRRSDAVVCVRRPV